MSGGFEESPGGQGNYPIGVDARLPLLIYGSGTYAHTVRDLAVDVGYEVVGLLDDMLVGPNIVGTLDTARRDFPTHSFGLVIGIGYSDLQARWRAWHRARYAGWQIPTLVHPRAYVARSARLADGCVVMAGAIIDRESKLGEAVVVWPGACINHDVAIGDNAFISPNATLCGFVRVGSHVFIGAGAVIADHRQVPESSFVKLGTHYAGQTK